MNNATVFPPYSVVELNFFRSPSDFIFTFAKYNKFDSTARRK